MDKETKNLLVFGYGLAALLSFFALRAWMKHHAGILAAVLGVAAVVILSITVMNRPLLKVFYTAWMKGARFIGEVVSGLVLVVLFYAVFAPAGIVLRLIGRDLLDEARDPSQPSYWHKRPAGAYDSGHDKRQF